MNESGIRPLYRPREWKTRKRAIQSKAKKNHWYRTRGDDAVIFIPATQRSALQKRYTKEIKASGLKIRVIGLTDISLKRLLQQSNPFKSNVCEKTNCIVCLTGGDVPVMCME